jgi:CRISPR system Cascade subunit CasB
MTVSPTPARLSLGQVLREDVVGRIESIQSGYLGLRGGAAQASAQAQLATLRGCDPADPALHPEAWSILMDQTPQELEPSLRSQDAPSSAERARHCAVVLYANHQQAKSDPMHLRGVMFGQAMRRLSDARRRDTEFDPSVQRRFDQVLLSPTWAGRAEHLRTLVRLLRGEGLGFDYGDFARDLLRLDQPRFAPSVRMSWGRDFYRRPKPTTDPTTTTGALA